MRILTCPACNHPVQPGAGFCTICGEKLPLSYVLPCPSDPTDRQQVRRLAEACSANLQRAAAAGGNVHQFSLEQSDAVNDYAGGLPTELALRFYELYNQELEALTAATMDQVQAAQATTLAREWRLSQLQATMATIMGALFFWWLLTKVL